jgi:hypothetical protein
MFKLNEVFRGKDHQATDNGQAARMQFWKVVAIDPRSAFGGPYYSVANELGAEDEVNAEDLTDWEVSRIPEKAWENLYRKHFRVIAHGAPDVVSTTHTAVPTTVAPPVGAVFHMYFTWQEAEEVYWGCVVAGSDTTCEPADTVLACGAGLTEVDQRRHTFEVIWDTLHSQDDLIIVKHFPPEEWAALRATHFPHLQLLEPA